ncbi:MAG: hypothetical protein DWQ34_15470 [Planctomycetota bacterium]|nr:MAG: hypothetical protein DWQ29_08070 [Planctomycetota bacterium]REJ91142.1 MAG: hypothetical protein DWQ34_15470 [Planctomycetota bacterium]REK20377.1 MAG: hypothetical protein DWQ41_25675 [Planctomycetota bacterium]REK26874.1 MAG: hypothetical protein DWQ45_26975 [Planctomycetota bacterium]
MATSAAGIETGAEHPRIRIRVLALGGVLDEAAWVVRERFGDLAKIGVAIVSVPLAVAAYFGLGPLEEMAQRLSVIPQAGPDELFQLLRQFAVVALPLLILAYRVAEPIALGAMTYLCAGAMLGERPTIGRSIRRALRYSPALIIAWGIRWFCFTLGWAMCYVPGVLLGGIFAAVIPPIVLERAGPFAALGRSATLCTKQFGRACFLVIALLIIETMVMAIAQVVPQLSVRAVLMALLYPGVLCFSAAASTSFYFSCRSVAENYDLELHVDEVVRETERLESDAGSSPFSSPEPD